MTALSGKTGGQWSHYMPSSTKDTNKFVIKESNMSGLYTAFNPSSLAVVRLILHIFPLAFAHVQLV